MARAEPSTASAQPLERGDLAEARAALPDLRAAVARADLSEPARRAAEKGITDIDDALATTPTGARPPGSGSLVIFAGPATNLVFCVVALAVVFSLGVVAGATREVDTVIRRARPRRRPASSTAT